MSSFQGMPARHVNLLARTAHYTDDLEQHNYLDLTPLGRQEEGMEDTLSWIRHHDLYGDPDDASCHG
jgi:predicted dithiol-disulfide oxidoreductase (DUF899 family)